jgi:hypothetical protein
MKRISTVLLAATTSFAVACIGGNGTGDDGGDDDGSGSNVGDEWDQELAKRDYDYNAALKIAALRLTGDLPTLDEIASVRDAADNAAKKVAYEALIVSYMGRPTFAREMFQFWRDTFKMGETPELDNAPALAAMISTGVGKYTDLFTSPSGKCPTFDPAAGTFTAGECAGTQPQAGVLSNPGAMRHYFGNFAFRRVKWIQETFACTKFPITSQLQGTPTDNGGATPYTGMFPISTIAGLQNGGRVDFQDGKAVQCGHCHQNLNHLAPMFANFDDQGVYQNQIAVPTPLDGAPLAQASDYLPPGEGYAWRFGVPVTDIPTLGAAMAADPDVAACGVARMWNWALGKTDIVDTLQTVPNETIATQITAFQTNFNLKDLIYGVFTADDFVKF